MKRMFLGLLLSGLVISGSARAQATDGGLPWTVTEQRAGNYIHNIPVTILPTPDYAKAIEEDKTPSSGAYRFGLNVAANIDLKNSGKVIYLNDGRKIWTTQIKVEGALATSLNYDQFYLPKGVNLFLKNENGKQVVGAFNEKHNPDDGIYSTTFTQGEVVVIELDMDNSVDLSEISLRVNEVIAVYRGGFAEDLQADFGSLNGADIMAGNRPLDGSHPCQVNALCEPEGSVYAKLRHTAASVYMGGYVCSGNLINNTSKDCKPLFLMASHCESGNKTTNTTFSTWRFYFNYEYPLCTNNTVSSTSLMNEYITGANFRARSYYDPLNPSMVGDFLLLELKDNPIVNLLGNDFHAYLAGWDLSQSPPSGKFIGFHHPSGDPKKLTVFKKMTGNGSFNGGALGSHWKLSFLEKGGIEGGSSGSGIFAMTNGRIYGDLSGGPTKTSPCDDPDVTVEQNYSVYSKLYLNWEYASAGDGTSATRLKDWLDPTNTGKTFTNTIRVASDDQVCGEDDVSIKETQELENSINVYPNPSSGIVNLQLNLSKAKDVQIDVINLLGVNVGVYSVKSVISGNVKMDLSQYPSGIYLLKVQTDKATVTKKVVLRK